MALHFSHWVDACITVSASSKTITTPTPLSPQQLNSPFPSPDITGSTVHTSSLQTVTNYCTTNPSGIIASYTLNAITMGWPYPEHTDETMEAVRKISQFTGFLRGAVTVIVVIQTIIVIISLAMLLSSGSWLRKVKLVMNTDTSVLEVCRR